MKNANNDFSWEVSLKTYHRKTALYILVITGLMIVAIYCLSERNLVAAVRTFLQPTIRTPGASVLVVEDWLPPHVLRAAKIEFDRGGYTLLVIPESEPSNQTGSQGSPIHETEAYNAAIFLRLLGIDSTRVIPISVESAHFHHTFSSANAVKRWLVSSGRIGTSVNVFTANTHGRKSWVAYRRTLRGIASVGIISEPISNSAWQSYKGIGLRAQLIRMYIFFKHGFGYLYALVWPLFLIN